MAKNLFNRYIWLVDTLYRLGPITYKEISERWQRNEEMSEGKQLPLRTFHNHRQEIEMMFDINIECDKQNRYFIDNADDIQRGGVRTWLLNTFAVNNLINESHKIKNRILFEQIPSGQQYLTPIIEAMSDGRCITMTYQSFWHPEPHDVVLEPYCVKVFRQRWYVIGCSVKQKVIRTYSLDRIQRIEIMEQSFKLPKSFDSTAYFANSFGIIVEQEVPPCVVKLKAYDKQADYIRTLPLHASQQEIEKSDEYSVFSYYIAPTFDFVQEILSRGNEVEVLSPERLRREIVDKAAQIVERYKIEK
jgi:hypothetical protein